MKQKKIFLILLMFTSILSQNVIINSNADHVKVPFVYLYYWDLTNVSQDGVISENEYPDTFIMEDLGGDFVSEVSWGHDNTTIAVGITINGTGWMGLGMGEVGTGMAGADIIMASFDTTTSDVTINDMYAIEQNDPIIDVDQYPFASVGGSESDGLTTIEFTIPLASNDAAGKDHFWHVGSYFGFFTAFRTDGKTFDKEHHAHSPPKDVKILDASYLPPDTIEHTFTVTEDTSTGELVLSSTLSGSLELEGHEIGFFFDTLFGELKIEDVFTDSQGHAETRFKLDKTGFIEFTSIFFGDEGHKRNERRGSIQIQQLIVGETDEYNDLRDIFGSRFMRTVMLFGFFFVIIMLLYVYGTSILTLVQINKLGKEFDMSKSTKGGENK